MIAHSLKNPALVLNEDICRNNIRQMAKKAVKAGTELNPHFKTHQSDIIGNWFRESGVERATVSSVQMADYFYNAGWREITIAFPFNIRQTEWINTLEDGKKLTVNVIDSQTAVYLAEHLKRPVEVLIEIDAGYGRTGVLCSDYEKLDSILGVIRTSKYLSFYGFYIHPGHSYDVGSQQEITGIIKETLDCLHVLKERYVHDFPELKLSLGDTPGCSTSDEFPEIDEIRPGNFVFYDLMQYHLGSCGLNDIGVALAAPVVAKEDSRHEIVIHGGAIHLSKDMVTRTDGLPDYGWVTFFNEHGWDTPDGKSYIRKLSQEHGIVRCTASFYNRVKTGDIIAVLPMHSCLTADCMKRYFTLSGKEIRMMPVF